MGEGTLTSEPLLSSVSLGNIRGVRIHAASASPAAACGPADFKQPMAFSASRQPAAADCRRRQRCMKSNTPIVQLSLIHSSTYFLPYWSHSFSPPLKNLSVGWTVRLEPQKMILGWSQYVLGMHTNSSSISLPYGFVHWPDLKEDWMGVNNKLIKTIVIWMITVFSLYLPAGRHRTSWPPWSSSKFYHLCVYVCVCDSLHTPVCVCLMWLCVL